MKGKERNKRRSVNAVSLFVTCLFLFLAVQLSDGGGLFATKINRITENLDKAVLGLNVTVTYSDFNDTSVYNSSTEFHAGGMAGLYNLTNLFIDTFVPSDILMPGLISSSQRGVAFNIPEVSSFLKYYAGLVAIVLFLAICLVLFPLCGLCFCCCRCCGNCGATARPSDKKRDTCRKVIQATLLIVCGTALLFCVVCAFSTNQQLQDGIERFPKNMDDSISDTITYMDSTNEQLRHLLVNNYQEFSSGFNVLMTNGSDIAMEQLKQYSNASAVSEISNFVFKLGDINTTLHTMKSNTNKLRVYASQLNDALRKVKRDLRSSLNDCKIQDCEEMKKTIERLQTSIDFNAVPDVSGTISSLNRLNISGIQNAVEEANNQLQSIYDKISEYLSGGLVSAQKQIENTASLIHDNLASITKTIDEVKTQINQSSTPAIQTAQRYIDQYAKYRYYVGLTVSCALLLVAIFITLGLICGICGKRPDGYNDNCCNKGAGGQFLICSVMLMFLFGFILSIITLITLILGVFSEKLICDSLKQPNSSRYTIIKLLDDQNIDLGINITPSQLLNNCYNNESIYHTFNLETKFNIKDIRSKFNISAELEKINISGAIGANFRLLTDDQLAVLHNLKNFDPQLDVDKFADELEKNFTNYSVTELTTSLENIINKPQVESIKNQLELSLLHLNTYNEKLIVPMRNLSKDLLVSVKQLNEDLKMNKTNFTEAITDLITEIDEAQTALRENGSQNLNQTADAFKNLTLGLISDYLDRIERQVVNEIGRCGPLSLVVNATLVSTCDKILVPWNGFWFTLFWAVILFVITIIISVRLANLYQKHKPYDQYVETEYLYDAYADRGDNIPLNSRGGKRGKKKGKKTKRHDERSNVGREVAREYVAGSHPPDGRYADMAPKHWEEFPNGGPPHYQRAPTEYERPPPYYYPGSAGEQ